QDVGLLEKRDRGMAVLRAQRGRPPLVLLEQASEGLPALLGQLERRGRAIEDLHLLELVAQQDLLELELLLDVLRLAALLDPVERRLRDIDVASLDQALHLPEEEGEDERPDVRTVDVGVGHEDHLVITKLLEIELLADAR